MTVFKLHIEQLFLPIAKLILFFLDLLCLEVCQRTEFRTIIMFYVHK